MEAVFPVPTSRALVETDVSNSVHRNANVCQVDSSHMNIIKYQHSTHLNITNSDHSSVTLDHLVSSVSSPEPLMRFTDDLNLSMKNATDCSLGDDEDDDVRSLLAAVAAAGTSPRSPSLRSSSGLNTPPDNRSGRSFDSPTCQNLKGTCDQSSARLLSSRLTLTEESYTAPNDSLVVLLSTSKSDPQTTLYLESSNASVSSMGSLQYRPHSPISSCNSNYPSITTCSHIDQSSVMLSHSNLPHASVALLSDHISSHYLTSPKLASDKIASQPGGFDSYPHKSEQILQETYSTLNDAPNSSHNSTSFASLSSLNTASLVSTNVPQLASTTSKCSFEKPAMQITLDCISAAPVSKEQSLTCTNQDHMVIVSQWPDSLIPVTPTYSSRPGDDTDHGNLAETDYTVANTTAENLIDLEQIISSHSASLAAVDDDFFAKHSEEEFNVSCSVAPNNVLSSHREKKHQSLNSYASCSIEPDFPESFTDINDNCCSSSIVPSTVHMTNTVDHVSQYSTPKHSAETTFTPNISESDSIYKYGSKSPILNSTANHVSKDLKQESDHSNDKTNLTLQEFPKPPNDSANVYNVTLTPVTDDAVDVKATVINHSPNNPIVNSDACPGNLTTSIMPTSEFVPEEECDESDYAAAAIAAVEDVVYALAGNRKPDPSWTADPALQGTGTDRIYTLSLAPIQQESQLFSQLNSSAIRTNVSSSTFQIFRPELNSGYHLPSSTGIVPQCTDYHYPIPSNDTNGVPNADEILVKTSDDVDLSVWNNRDPKADFVCPACLRIFPPKSLLLKHRDEPKHICSTCGRCFLREDKLKRHVMSIHTAEKPHICHICSKAFSRKDKLKDHLKHHDRAARNFECQQCLQPFVQKSDLNRHIRGVHQGEPGVGINMTSKRKAPGTALPRLTKKKSQSNSSGETLESSNDALKECTFNPDTSSVRNLNGKINGIKRKSNNSTHVTAQLASIPTKPARDPVTSVSSVSSLALVSAASATSAITFTSATPTPMTSVVFTNASHPVFSATASGLMLPTMALTHAHQRFIQHQQAAAAQTLMLPAGHIASITHPSSITLQQQQQQFFAMAAIPTLAQAHIAQANGLQASQPPPGSLVNNQQAQIHFQSELKAVATPSGPMMVLTRIAAANQANPSHQLVGQGVFPQVVGFHPTAAQHHQLHQLQQQHVVMAHHQHHQQQLLQQQHANYAAVAAAAASGTQLVAVSNQHVGGDQTPSVSQSITSQTHFHQQQLVTHQLQQQQMAALAAQQQAAHNFLFSPAASGTTIGPSTGPSAAFFCHPQDSMTAGLILATSADPAGFALAAAQAQAMAVAAQQRQQQNINPIGTPTSSGLSSAAIAAATGLQVVTGYAPSDIQQTVSHQQLSQQHQLLLQQHRLAAVAAATGVSSTSSVNNPTSAVIVPPGTSIINGNTAPVLISSSQDEQVNQIPQSTHFMVAQQESGSSSVMNNCYQLAAFTNAAAALYQQQHPGLMFATTNGNSCANPANANSATMAAMASLHQQQYHQQQQASLVAAYHQQQQMAQQHAFQHSHTHSLQNQQQQPPQTS